MEPFQTLEKEFQAWTCPQHEVVACSSGTSALHLALESLQLPPKSEVLVPDFTMIACARAVTLAGLTPVFIDCGTDLLIDCDKVAAYLKDNCRWAKKNGEPIKDVSAIMPVHIYGRRCDMKRIIELATEYDLYVIEDLAECHGVAPHHASDAAAWSFYKNKAIHGEEGGAVAFHCTAAADLARKLRCLGFTDAHDFMHVARGHNYRMSNAHARLILDSLHDASFELARRRRVEEWWEAAIPDAWRMPPRLAPWVVDIRVPNMTGTQQAAIVKALNVAGIAARMAFKPMTWQPEYRTIGKTGGEAAIAAREVFYLPLGKEVTEDTVKRAVAIIHQLLAPAPARL